MTEERPQAAASRAKPRGALREALTDERDGPLPAMLLALTFLAGIVDATSLLALDQVFVAAMTGNIVFIGLGLSGAPGFSWARSALALASFAVGVLIGARTCRRSRDHRGLAVRNIVLSKLLLAAPVTVIAVIAGGELGPWSRIAITVLLAMSMGGQLALIRYLKVPDLVTVVLTLTMTGVLTERGGRDNPAVLRRGLALLAFALGVFAGGLLARLVAAGAALGLGLVVIIAVGIAAQRVSRSAAPWTARRER